MSNQTIISYIRDRKGQLRGAMVASKTGEEEFNVGWSLCNRQEDTFNKKFGVELAYRRAHSGFDRRKIPQSIWQNYVDMTWRGAKYFKGCDLKESD